VSAGVAYRLTAADESAITARVRETVTRWASPGSPGSAGGRSLVQVTAVDRLALQRIGAHAIGCGSADLREFFGTRTTYSLRGSVA
jgi:hypothetical protein